MKILVIGDGSSIHIKNYLKVVYSDWFDGEVTLFDLSSNNSVDDIKYNINMEKLKIVTNNSFDQLVSNKILKKIPKLRSIIYSYLLESKIKEMGSFDYCILQYVDSTKVKIVLNNAKQFRHIVPVFWGSDVLRNKELKNRPYNKLFEQAHKIVFNTENMKKVFQSFYGSKFQKKSEIIKFPTLSFEKIKSIESMYNKSDLKKELKFPNRHIVVCGHSANAAEQHELLIESLSKCKKETLDKCYFVFPMSYGDLNLKMKQEKIFELLKKRGISGEIIIDYLTNEQMLKILMCADIYITTIKTDAFSAVLQESLYSGSHVLYGKWLNYFELEQSNIIAEPLKEISEVSERLEYMVENLVSSQETLSGNRELISNISSPEMIKEMWKKYVFNQ